MNYYIDIIIDFIKNIIKIGYKRYLNLFLVSNWKFNCDILLLQVMINGILLLFNDKIG